jgi:hypothetical protein
MVARPSIVHVICHLMDKTAMDEQQWTSGHGQTQWTMDKLHKGRAQSRWEQIKKPAIFLNKIKIHLLSF